MDLASAFSLVVNMAKKNIGPIITLLSSALTFLTKSSPRITRNRGSRFSSLKLLLKFGAVVIAISVLFHSKARRTSRATSSTKKLGEESSFYNDEGIHPEFVRMSRRPGIGAGWYNQYKSDLYPHGYAVIRGGVKSKIPRFYEKKFEESNPLLLQKIKEKRKKIMEEKWDENSPFKLKIKEHIKRAQLRSLKRTLNQ